MADVTAPNGKNSFWRVDDSVGRDHGTYDRDTAAAVTFDRIAVDCLDREWVIGPQPQPNKARHGNRNAALDPQPTGASNQRWRRNHFSSN
ncbi:hypothetical protein B7L17_011635 [Burkholderia cenocepacia]|uniref:hypothetical protein n=1 Tax=Burkholderia cenocepacia TaxID=95486 RepID=UPI0022375450|nr:hypothetical protein [Burkholderia cenocepacia]MCW5118610.1 hypothetical protein [Burkholderia cenocepacia]MCW5130921.1 hypothetical protein [Burkholderia cenocepacia]MCW5174047.1 hypothetical protein [Burkholderia cenocepacia]